MLASEKLANPFELHADIIVKRYGHKLNLATGHRGLILDVVVEVGNPAELSGFLPMIERRIARCRMPPRQIAADSGYASQDKLKQAKARGGKDFFLFVA
jgi:transposase, IS5 family